MFMILSATKGSALAAGGTAINNENCPDNKPRSNKAVEKQKDSSKAVTFPEIRIPEFNAEEVSDTGTQTLG